MMKYIERDALLDGMYENPSCEYEEGWNNALNGAMLAIPPVDAVEVVRCKYCKWRGDVNGCAMDDPYAVTDNDFCSYGKRRVVLFSDAGTSIE